MGILLQESDQSLSAETLGILLQESDQSLSAETLGILLQETHSTNDKQLHIPGFNIVAANHHQKHGITTYARSDVPARIVATSLSIRYNGLLRLSTEQRSSVPFTHLPQYILISCYLCRRCQLPAYLMGLPKR